MRPTTTPSTGRPPRPRKTCRADTAGNAAASARSRRTTGPRDPTRRHLTTADDLTALCCDCHDEAHDFRFFLDAGGLPDDYRTAHSELVASLVRPADDGRQVGRAVWFEGEWGALITGRARPRVGESFWLFLRSRRAWQNVVVTEVVDGRPGHWRVRKRWCLGPADPSLPWRASANPESCRSGNAPRQRAVSGPLRARCPRVGPDAGIVATGSLVALNGVVVGLLPGGVLRAPATSEQLGPVGHEKLIQGHSPNVP